MTITVLINTFNEEKNIIQCLDSALLLTNSILVVDMESTDKTIELIKNSKAEILYFPKSNYVEPAREFGINKVKSDWVFILDADERMTKELAEEIKSKISKFDNSYYKIPRKNIFSNIKWFSHGGWWPDYQTRLINKKSFVKWPKRIHSTPTIKGNFGYLKNPLIHYFHGDLTNMVKKTVIFEDIESELLYKAGKKTTTKTFFRKYFAELYRRLIKNLGFLDGSLGIIESIYQAFSKTMTYLFLFEKQNKNTCLPAGKIALYNPYLDILGGGEKHIFSIMEVFAQYGYEINIFWNENLDKKIKNRFSFKYFDKVKWLPNIFKNNVPFSTLKKSQALQAFDYFFYVTDGSYFFSGAKNNYVFCMVPEKKLYNLNLLNKLKLWNYKFISNSPFTTKWLSKWNINPITIPPYINDKLFIGNIKKQKIILSVGRFFSHLHSKNQEKIIESFKLLKQKTSLFKDYKLVLVGGLKAEDKKYLDYLKKVIKNDSSIIIKPNIEISELYRLYEISNYFWHFTGFGINENLYPEQVEHFGIAPLEAMASGCLTFCYDAGGPKELIKDNGNGFLFNTSNELIEKMIEINLNKTLKEKVMNNGKRFVKKNFSYEVFRSKVVELIKVRPYIRTDLI